MRVHMEVYHLQEYEQVHICVLILTYLCTNTNNAASLGCWIQVLEKNMRWCDDHSNGNLYTISMDYDIRKTSIQYFLTMLLTCRAYNFLDHSIAEVTISSLPVWDVEV